MLKNLRTNKFIPTLLLLLVWIIFSFPYIFLGKVPYPSDYQVNKFLPWSQNEKTLGPIKNEAMPDVIGQIYPWRFFTISELKKGQIPFWNPYSFSGTPHLANYQSAVFSPFNIIFLILPFVDAWSINILLQPLIAGIGIYFFLKSRKLSDLPSLISAVSFMFCGFMTVWMAYGTLSMAAAFLPLALFLVEKFLLSERFKYILFLAVSITTSFFTGHFQTSFYVLIFVILYITYRVFSELIPAKKVLILLSGLVLSLIISSIQILPTINFYNQAIRQTLIVSGGGIPFSYLITLISPDFFGNPVTRNNWYGLYAEWASFIGIIPLSLSLFNFSTKRTKDVYFFTFTTFLFLALAVDGPAQRLMISTHLPILSTSMPSRIIVLFSFSISILAGFGAESLSSLIKTNKYKKILPTLLALPLFLLLITLSIFVFHLLPDQYRLLAIKNLFLPVALSILFFIITLLSVKITQLKKFILIIAFLFICFDSLRFASKWMPFSEKKFVYSQTNVLDFLNRNINHDRVVGNYAAYIDTYFKIPSLEGYDSLYIKRYGEFLEAAVDGKYHTPQRNVVYLARNGKFTNRVITLLGVKYFFHVKNDTKKSWAFPVWSNKKIYKKVYSDMDFEIYSYLKYQKRARIYYDSTLIKDSRSLLKKFYTESFDYKKTLLLEKDTGISSKQSRNKVEFILDEPSRIILKVFTERRGILFLADPYYPNWKAKVNGQQQEIYLADYAFRAVVVPKGISRVEFYYSYF